MDEIHFKYKLANTSGYKFNICKLGYHNYDDLAYYFKDNFPDVQITRPGTNTDLAVLHNKCLMTVNGYVYMTQLVGEELFIANATKNMLRARNNSIGLISFNKLKDPLHRYIITPEMISEEKPYSLYDKCIITFPDEIVSPILCLAGYLIFENEVNFYRINERSFVLRLDRLHYTEMLYELSRYRSIFSELEVPLSPNNPSMFETSNIRSNETIIKFLTTYNSFLITVPVEKLNTRRVYLEHSNVPGNFRCEKEPISPIQVGYGKLAEYVSRQSNDHKYTCYTTDAMYNQHLISSKSTGEIKVYNDHRLVGATYRLSQAYFLDIWANV